MVARTQRREGLLQLDIEAPAIAARVGRLESVAVNGVCLTVARVRQATLGFELITETLRCTTLGRLRAGSRVNLEPSLTLTDRLNGHVVLGHIDGMGTLASRREQRGELVLTIRVPRSLRRWLVPKGPVTVDGVSLTIGSTITPTTFTIHLIPETLRQTTLRSLQPGNRVNLEADYLAKLVRQ